MYPTGMETASMPFAHADQHGCLPIRSPGQRSIVGHLDQADFYLPENTVEAASAVLVSTLVLAETTWVVRRAYKHSPTEVAAALRGQDALTSRFPTCLR
jgi:hypothetical protein